MPLFQKSCILVFHPGFSGSQHNLFCHHAPIHRDVASVAIQKRQPLPFPARPGNIHIHAICDPGRASVDPHPHHHRTLPRQLIKQHRLFPVPIHPMPQAAPAAQGCHTPLLAQRRFSWPCRPTRARSPCLGTIIRPRFSPARASHALSANAPGESHACQVPCGRSRPKVKREAGALPSKHVRHGWLQSLRCPRNGQRMTAPTPAARHAHAAATVPLSGNGKAGACSTRNACRTAIRKPGYRPVRLELGGCGRAAGRTQQTPRHAGAPLPGAAGDG